MLRAKMSAYTVVFTPEAEQHLAELYHYISEKSSTDTAHLTMAIVDYCAADLRIVNFRGSTDIAIAVDDVTRIITIVGIFYGG